MQLNTILSVVLLFLFFVSPLRASLSRESGRESFFVGSGIPPKVWGDHLNQMLSYPGPRMDFLKSTKNTTISRAMYALGIIEIEAFEIIASNQNKTIEQLVEILNSQISIDRTIYRKPYYIAKVFVWHNKIINEGAQVLRGENKQWVTKYLQRHFAISRSKNGIGFLSLSEEAWTAIILPFLCTFTPRMWPELDVLSWSPRENHRFLPDVAAEFIHQNLVGLARYAVARSMFDSTSELSKRMRRYALTILVLSTLDGRVMRHLLTNSQCESSDLEQLGIQMDKLFIADSRPAYNAPYTAERLGVWCREILPLAKKSINGINDFVAPHPEAGTDVYRLTDAMTQKYIIAPLRVTNQTSSISAYDVLIAWEKFNASAPTSSSSKRRYEHELPIGSGDKMAAQFLNLNSGARRQVLEKFLTETSTPIANLAQPADLAPIRKRFSVSAVDLLAYANYIKSLRVIPEILANELVRVYEQRSETTATAVLNVVTKRGVQTHFTPQDVGDIYEMLVESIKENSEKPFELIGHHAHFPIQIWRDFIVSKRLSLLQ